jgi:hypothetical protein
MSKFLLILFVYFSILMSDLSLAGTSKNQLMPNIVFQYGNREMPSMCDIDTPYEQIIQNIKFYFNLPAASFIIFIDSVSNRTIMASKAADFWNFSAMKVPKYDLIIRTPSGKKNFFKNIIKYFIEIYLNKRFNVKHSIEINLNLISFLIDTHHGIGGENKPKKKK